MNGQQTKVTREQIFAALTDEQVGATTERQREILRQLRGNPRMNGLEADWQRSQGATPMNQRKR